MLGFDPAGRLELRLQEAPIISLDKQWLDKNRIVPQMSRVDATATVGAVSVAHGDAADGTVRLQHLQT